MSTALTTEASPPLIGTLQTGHVGLNVTDVERATRFYQDVFGFAVLLASGDGDRRFAVLGHGDRIVLTLWQQSAGTFATGRPGLHHLSFQVDEVAQVREVERRLRQAGATIHHDGIVPHAEGMASGGIYFDDPDGIRLEVFAPTGVHGHAPSGEAPTCAFF